MTSLDVSHACITRQDKLVLLALLGNYASHACLTSPMLVKMVTTWTSLKLVMLTNLGFQCTLGKQANGDVSSMQDKHTKL